MSDARRPTPNGSQHHDDPPAGRGADAHDADALDALLDGIAQGNGVPSPRSANGPNVRSDDRTEGERAALHAAARQVHRRFEAAAARDPGSAALDPQLWETIMTASTAPAAPPSPGPTFPANPWRGATARVPRAAAPTRPAVVQRAPGHWAPLANATLALVILLAGFGIWRVYDGLDGTGPGEPESTVPGIAMQPGTPEAPPVVMAPVATPTPAYACDFSASIPIIPAVDRSPVDGTALLLTTDQELVLACPEEPQGVVLANRVQSASAMRWPGIVFLAADKVGSTSGMLLVVNVMTGESVEIGMRPDSVQYQLSYDVASPWLVAPAATNPRDWAITDLRTMESRLLSDYAATAVPRDASIFTSANAGGGLVVGLRTPNDEIGNGELLHGGLMEDGGLPGGLLVLEGSLDASHWIDVPDDLPPVRELTLAPDGRHLALRGSEHEFEPEVEAIYSIVRTRDGGEVARSEVVRPDEPIFGMRWVQGGKALAYTSDTRLRLLSTAPGTEPETLLESDDALVELGTTYDPNVVIVHRLQAEEVATETPDQVQPRLYSVDTVTGQTIEIDGVDVSHTLSPWDLDTRFLVMGDTYIQHMNGETEAFRVVDAVTGEVLDELTDVQISQDPDNPMMGLRSVVSTSDGSTEVIGFGASQLYLLRDAGGMLDIRQLPAINPDAESYIGSVPLWIADDGTHLSLTIDGDESGMRYLIDLTDPDAAWIAVPSGVIEPGYGPDSIFFVPSTGD